MSFLGEGVGEGDVGGGVEGAAVVISLHEWSFNYAPNFEEVEGAYWFAPVRLSV